jgi:hypothetical protein
MNKKAILVLVAIIVTVGILIVASGIATPSAVSIQTFERKRYKEQSK